MLSKALQELEKICLVVLLPQEMNEEDYISLVLRDVKHFFRETEALYVLSSHRLDHKKLPSQFWLKPHVETLNISNTTSIIKKLISIREKEKDTMLIDISCLSVQSLFPVLIFTMWYGARLFFFENDEIRYLPVKTLLNTLDKAILVALKADPVESITKLAKLVKKSPSTTNYRLKILAEWELIDIRPKSQRKKTIRLTSIGSAFAEAFSELAKNP